MFLGGPSLNKGVVAAFENVLDRGLLVPLHREVLGALRSGHLCSGKKCNQKAKTAAPSGGCAAQLMIA